MKYASHCAVIIAVISLTTAVMSANVSKPMQITVTTSLLRCAVQEIGGNHVTVHTLITPGSCPGHFDIAPKDMRLLTNSKIVFTHGYESFIASAVKSSKLKVTAIKIQGNWMKPEVYNSALAAVTKELSISDPSHRKEYQTRLNMLRQKYLQLSKTTRTRLRSMKVSDAKVLCSSQQYEFAVWAGLQVIGTYGSSDDFTPQLLHQLTKIGRTQHVKLCIDNLQSGPTAGRQLAADIGAAHIALSNFPGGYSNTASWQACYADNVNRIITVLRHRR